MSDATSNESPPAPSRPDAPRRRAARALAGLRRARLVLGLWSARRRGRSAGQMVSSLGRIEVTARLLECPEQFPDLGAYRYTYVLKYEVLQVHRQTRRASIRWQPGDASSSGHYKPWCCRARRSATPIGGHAPRRQAHAVRRRATPIAWPWTTNCRPGPQRGPGLLFSPKGIASSPTGPTPRPFERRAESPWSSLPTSSSSTSCRFCCWSTSTFPTAPEPPPDRGQLRLLRLVGALVRLPHDA